MEISEVRVTIRNDDKLKAFASVTFNECFVVRGLKVIQGNKGLFVAMPSRRRPDGTFQDIAHPINSTMRETIEQAVIGEYEEELARTDDVVSTAI